MSFLRIRNNIVLLSIFQIIQAEIGTYKVHNIVNRKMIIKYFIHCVLFVDSGEHLIKTKAITENNWMTITRLHPT